MGNRTLLHQAPGVQQVLHTDPHMKDRQVFRTVFHNDAALRRNEQIRNSGMMRRGDKMSVLDGATVSHAFSFPTIEEYQMIRRKYPDIMDALRSKDQAVREKAADQLQLLCPQYVTISEKS